MEKQIVGCFCLLRKTTHTERRKKGLVWLGVRGRGWWWINEWMNEWTKDLIVGVWGGWEREREEEQMKDKDWWFANE